jgi:hypothetical protein
MNLLMILYTVLLFVILTPAILVHIPPNGNKLTVAFVHGLIFALIYHFTHHFVLRLGSGIEGYTVSLNIPINSNKFIRII